MQCKCKSSVFGLHLHFFVVKYINNVPTEFSSGIFIKITNLYDSISLASKEEGSVNVIKKRLRISGMTCINCQNKIGHKLKNTVGIKEAVVSYNTGYADITYDSDIITVEDIEGIIKKLGYRVLKETEKTQNDIKKMISMLVIIVSLYVLFQQLGILNLLVPSQLADTKMGYGMLFMIGMITSVHCIAMCGGINLSQCIPSDKNREEHNHHKRDKHHGDGNRSVSKLDTFKPAFLYNFGRVFSYTAIGCFLGFIGMIIGGGSGGGISTLFQGILKMIAGVFMVIMGINMLGIFPWLRQFNLRMPKFLAIRIGRKKAAGGQHFAVGLLNGLMPCGPLQSMQLVALASGNPFTGALSMFSFSLGTVPLMLGFGSLVSALGKKFSKEIMNVGAVLVVVLGLAMLSQGGSLSGILLPKQLGVWSSSKESADASGKIEIQDGKQVINSTLSSGKYPNITVQMGIPVKWIIDAPEGTINGCNYKMLLKEYGIEHTFDEGENIIEFTPGESGAVQYTCWMGMIRGNIFVVDENKKEDKDLDNK